MRSITKRVVIVAGRNGEREAIDKAIERGNSTNWGFIRGDLMLRIEPTCFDDIVAALAHMRKGGPPALVIVEADVRTRDDGVALLNELRDRGDKTPRVLVTGYNDPKAFERVQGWTEHEPRFWCVGPGLNAADNMREILGRIVGQEALAA